MPLLNDIMDHKVFGPLIRQGIEEGRQHERQVLASQIEKRFGKLPPAARQRLESLTPAETEALALRILDAHSLEEVLQ